LPQPTRNASFGGCGVPNSHCSRVVAFLCSEPMSEETSAGSVRLFVAIGLPEALRDEIQTAQTTLQRAVPTGGIRWTPREQFHLTLRFLGNVEVERVEQLTRALGAACAGFARLQLRAEAVGFFPSGRRPRVVWVGANDTEGHLGHLQQTIQTATSEFTEEDPETQFSGHVTLARAKNLRRPEAQALVKVASGLAGRVFGEWTAPEVELVQSELSADGAKHGCRARIPLGG
jgi:RNA 2',3'-cyclic 3'-phosphodiesterase